MATRFSTKLLEFAQAIKAILGYTLSMAELLPD
jgi:hypothetical protein